MFVRTHLKETIIKSNTITAVLIAAAGVILFSTKAVIVKLAYNYNVDPITLLLFRMLFSLPFYFGVFLLNRKKWALNPLSTKQKYSLVLIGLLGYYLASYLDFQGLSYITASLERLILFSYPTFVLLMSMLFLKKKITGAQIISILITYTGIAIIFYDRGGITDGDPQEVLKGSAFVFGSAITYAAYLVGSNSLIANVGSKRLTTYSLTVSCISVIIHYGVTHQIDLFSYPVQVYLLSIAMAFFATVIPSFLINEAIKRIGAPTVAIVGSLGPVSTISLSMIFLGEMLTFTQFMGALVIILGVVFITRNK